MLEISAATYNDLVPVVPVVGAMPAEGGMVGRDDDNDLVLPDPLCRVSRKQFHFSRDEDGAYHVRNISELNPALIDDVPLAPGMSCKLHGGERISVGSYVLSVRIGRDTAPVTQEDPMSVSEQATPVRAPLPHDDPFDQPYQRPDGDPIDALESRGLGLEDFSAKPDELINGPEARDMERTLTRDPLAENGGALDPLAMFGGGSMVFGRASDLASVLERTDKTPPNSSNLDHGSEIDAIMRLPTPLVSDGDPNEARPPSHEVAEKRSATPGKSVQHDFIDDLLEGIGAAGTGDPGVFGGMANDGADTSSIPAYHETDSGILAGLCDEIPPASEVLPDASSADAADERAAVGDPHPLSEDEGTAYRIDMATEAHPDISIDSLMGDRFGEGEAGTAIPELKDLLGECGVHEHGQPEASHHDPIGKGASGAAEGKPAVDHGEQPVDATAPAGRRETAQAGESAELFDALLQGLGIGQMPHRERLDKHFMLLIGQLLRAFAEGSVELMAARAAVRREVKANVTLIAPEHNNPLKFSPDGEVALLYLLGNPYPGFMPPVDAVTHAYADLRAHQIGVVSGMRSALHRVLDRFDPAVIDRSAAKSGMVDSLLAVGRKARLWEAYGRYFDEAREEAEDRFQDFFGRAFLEAYEDAAASAQKHRARSFGEDDR